MRLVVKDDGWQDPEKDYSQVDEVLVGWQGSKSLGKQDKRRISVSTWSESNTVANTESKTRVIALPNETDLFGTGVDSWPVFYGVVEYYWWGPGVPCCSTGGERLKPAAPHTTHKLQRQVTQRGGRKKHRGKKNTQLPVLSFVIVKDCSNLPSWGSKNKLKKDI